jgi:hypothetical protein
MFNRGTFLVVIAAISFTACGGGGGGGAPTGTLNLGVTDAPVDGVKEIWIEVTGVTLKPKSGSQLSYVFEDDMGNPEPMLIELTSLDDGKIAALLVDEEVPAGEYTWAKLDVNAEFDTLYDSYVVKDDDSLLELRVPSGNTSGLKLGNHFVVNANRDNNFVIDWDLRMGLTDPVSQPGYKLRPSLRIIDLTQYGTITGTVSMSLITDGSCTSDMNTSVGNVVYIWAGSDVTPDDIDDTDPQPVTSASVKLNNDSGEYEYSAPFLSVGPYTVAFTCQGLNDNIPDPEMLAIDTDDSLAFTPGQNATVNDDQTTPVNFP